MSGLNDVKNYAVIKSLEAAKTALEAADSTDEIRSLYADATIYRARDSFVREGDTLHIDIGKNSDLFRSVDEIETPSPLAKTDR